MPTPCLHNLKTCFVINCPRCACLLTEQENEKIIDDALHSIEQREEEELQNELG